MPVPKEPPLVKVWISPLVDATAEYFRWFITTAPRAVQDLVFGPQRAATVHQWANGTLSVNYTGSIPNGTFVESEFPASSDADSLQASSILLGFILAFW